MTNSFIAAQVSFKNDMVGNLINATNSTLAPPQISMHEFHEATTKYSLQYAYLGLAIMICAYIQVKFSRIFTGFVFFFVIPISFPSFSFLVGPCALNDKFTK